VKGRKVVEEKDLLRPRDVGRKLGLSVPHVYTLAAALLQSNMDVCEECGSAHDLLEAFDEVMIATGKKMRKAKRPPARQVSPDEIRDIIGGCERDVMVCIYSTRKGITKEWFIVGQPEKAA